MKRQMNLNPQISAMVHLCSCSYQMVTCGPAGDCVAALTWREGVEQNFNLYRIKVPFTGQRSHLMNKEVRVFSQCHYLCAVYIKWYYSARQSSIKRHDETDPQRNEFGLIFLPDRNLQIATGALFHPLEMSLHLDQAHIFFSHWSTWIPAVTDSFDDTQRTLRARSAIATDVCVCVCKPETAVRKNISCGKSQTIQGRWRAAQRQNTKLPPECDFFNVLRILLRICK